MTAWLFVTTKLRLLLSREIAPGEVGESITDPAQLELVLKPESLLLLRFGRSRRVLVLVLVRSCGFASGGSLKEIGSMLGLGVLSVITG
jgi:hypothetical protein